jgi:hypothetical protein
MATLVFDLGDDFFWELVTSIHIMLLGHWLEMRSVQPQNSAWEISDSRPSTAGATTCRPEGAGRATGQMAPRSPAELTEGHPIG